MNAFVAADILPSTNFRVYASADHGIDHVVEIENVSGVSLRNGKQLLITTYMTPTLLADLSKWQDARFVDVRVFDAKADKLVSLSFNVARGRLHKFDLGVVHNEAVMSEFLDFKPTPAEVVVAFDVVPNE